MESVDYLGINLMTGVEDTLTDITLLNNEHIEFYHIGVETSEEVFVDVVGECKHLYNCFVPQVAKRSQKVSKEKLVEIILNRLSPDRDSNYICVKSLNEVAVMICATMELTSQNGVMNLMAQDMGKGWGECMRVSHDHYPTPTEYLVKILSKSKTVIDLSDISSRVKEGLKDELPLCVHAGVFSKIGEDLLSKCCMEGHVSERLITHLHRLALALGSYFYINNDKILKNIKLWSEVFDYRSSEDYLEYLTSTTFKVVSLEESCLGLPQFKDNCTYTVYTNEKVYDGKGSDRQTAQTHAIMKILINEIAENSMSVETRSRLISRDILWY